MDASVISVTEEMTTNLKSPETCYGYEEFEISEKVVDDQENAFVKLAYISQKVRTIFTHLSHVASASA